MFQVFTQANLLAIVAEDAGQTSRFDDVPCAMVNIVAAKDNAGSIRIGGVTGGVADADATTGIELAAGEAYPAQIWINNLDRLSYYIAEAGDTLSIMVYT